MYLQFFHFSFELWRNIGTATAMLKMFDMPLDSLLNRWLLWHRVGCVPFPV
jgi:hypothetical protein